MEVIWDFMHYGWPDGLEIGPAALVDRFPRFAREAALLIEEESGAPLIVSVVNEISFMAWAAGTAGIFHPYGKCRGPEVKRQLVRVTIAAIDSNRQVAPQARFVQIDPLIQVLDDP